MPGSFIGIVSDMPLWVIIVAIAALLATAVVIRQKQTREPKCPFVVEPMPASFDWQKNPTYRYRPFKPVYHMVMNISKTNEADWLRIEDTYERVTQAHKETIQNYPNDTCKVDQTPETTRAVQELYNTVFGVLMQQYPMLFVPQGDEILNVIKATRLPRYAAASKLSSTQLLQILCENTEEDFQLLQFSPEEDEFVLRGVGGLTSDGFSWSSKVNKKLTDVHGPVPYYKEKLKMSMNRFFKKVEPGKFVERFTWGVHMGTPDQMFHPNWKKAFGEKNVIQESDLDFDNRVFLRVERQVPTKLPETGYLILSQHTHFYPLPLIKQEGLGPALADSIDAWPDAFAEYKGRPEWGDAVKSYLRRE